MIKRLDFGFLTCYIIEKVIGVFARLVSIFINVLEMMEVSWNGTRIYKTLYELWG